MCKFLIILATFMPISGFTTEQPTELQCLTANVFFEARGESPRGQRAIADVTINRTNHPSFPDSICAVVKQPWQFSWIKNDKRSRKVLKGDLKGFKALDIAAYRKAELVAVEALSNSPVSRLPRWVTHFHNNTVTPDWSRTMKRYGKVGQHTFYGFSTKK